MFFFLFPAAIFVSLERTQIWCLHTNLSKFVWNIMSNNSSMVDRTDLRLGQSPYLFMVYNVSISWLHSVNGFRFLFWWRDSENWQYKLYRYVLPQRVWFLSRFGLKMGIDFDHCGLKSGMVYKVTTRAYYKHICFFDSKWIVEKEKYPKYIIRAEFYQCLTLLLMRSLKSLKTGMNFYRGQVWKWVRKMAYFAL